MRKLAVLLVLLCIAPQSGAVQERKFSLSVPQSLTESGFLKYLLPRFSLKTGVRISVIDPSGSADARLNTAAVGISVFTGPQSSWYLEVGNGVHQAHVNRFADWIRSDIGRRTIEAYEIGGVRPYSAGEQKVAARKSEQRTGREVDGEKLSFLHCGRCHVVNAKNRLNAIGSTPSFALLRSFDDWKARFQTFYILNPHPAFTQVKDVTDPFDDKLPPPISPLEMTLDDISAIVDFAATLAPADLGAPIKHQ